MSTGNSRSPDSAGPSPIQDLRKLLSSWAREAGPPMSRPSWSDLQLLLLPLKGSPAAFWDTFLPSLPPSHALLATLVIAQSDTQVRAVFLQRACNAALQTPPAQLFDTLNLFPKELILSGFGPALLSPAPFGPLAAAVLAGLEITIAPGDVPLVLAASTGSAEMLEHLARLVPPEHIDSVIQDLDTQLDTSRPGVADLRDAFVELLKELPRRSLPAVEGDSPSKPPASTSPTAEPARSDETLAQAQARLAGLRAAGDGNAKRAEESGVSNAISSSLPGIDRNFLAGLVAIAICIPLILYLTTETDQEPAVTTGTPQVPAKVPKFWTDAVTKRKITREFLAADNDFQMGEMFLLREQFGDALSLFRDALHRDPEHVAAQFRIGCCLFSLDDHKGAAQAFRKSLEMQPDLTQANLFLARISVAAQEWDTAIAHYQKEFDLAGDVAIALEYAGTLRKLGRFPEAIKLLTSLPPRFSGHLEVVNLLAQLREDARGIAP